MAYCFALVILLVCRLVDLLVFRSHDQRSSQTAGLCTKMSAQYLLISLLERKVDAIREQMAPIDFQVTRSKVKAVMLTQQDGVYMLFLLLTKAAYNTYHLTSLMSIQNKCANITKSDLNAESPVRTSTALCSIIGIARTHIVTYRIRVIRYSRWQICFTGFKCLRFPRYTLLSPVRTKYDRSSKFLIYNSGFPVF